MNIEQNTKHAACAKQVERQVEKKSYTHHTDSQKQTNRQGMCVRETEAIIDKALMFGIHTPSFPLNSQVVVQTTVRGNGDQDISWYKQYYYLYMCLTPPREWMNVSQCTIHGRDRDVRCLAFFSFLSLPLLCFIPCLAPGDFTCHLLSFNFFNSFLLSAVSTTHPVVSLLTLAYPPCLAASELSYPTN